MSLDIKNTRDLTTPYLAVLAYGPPKGGKTTLLSTLGKAPLVVDFDDGLLVLKDLGVNYVQPRKWEEVLELVSGIRSGKLREKVQYDHIIWDSHTMFYDTIVVPSVLALSKHTTMSQPDWGMANERAKLVYDQLIKARTEQQYHFSLTCHEKIDKDEVSGIILGGVAATPELRTKLPAMFDELYYVKPLIQQGTQGKTAVYRVHTLPEGMFPAGTRSRMRLAAVEAANLSDIYNKIIADKPQGGK